MKKGIQLDPKDNVGVVIQDVAAGEEVDFGSFTVCARSDVKTPHKLALADLPEGTTVIKYGEVIGYTTSDVKKGDFMHVHNIESEKIMK